MEKELSNLDKILGTALVVILILWGSWVYFSAHQPQSYGDAAAWTLVPIMPVDTIFQVGPQVSVQVLATSTARIFASITATSTVYCNESDAVPSATNGAAVEIGLGQPLNIGPTNLYIGAVRCAAPASTTIGVAASQ